MSVGDARTKVVGLNLSNLGGGGGGVSSPRGPSGISVEDPCLFSYAGRWYYFTVMISNPDTKIGAQNLDNHHLELFEYTNEINSLCLYGNIIYNDIDGSISRFINRMDNHVEVVCVQMEKAQDGTSLEMFVETNREDGANEFKHTFIVQNIAILNRVGQMITYQISLISSAWYLLCSRIDFSNYPLTEAESDKKPRNGYRMMKKFLADAFVRNQETFKIDVDSFEACATKSKIEIPYITNGNDTVFTAKKYIFDMLYWSKDRLDESLKYIVYHPAQSIYRCINYGDENSWFKCAKPFIILSMFETDYEQQLFSVNNQLASMAGKNQTGVYEDLFKHQIWQYDPLLGRFGDDNSFEEKDMSEIYNNKTKYFDEMAGVKTEQKYPLALRSDWFMNSGTYYQQSPDWNRTYSIYQSIIDNLLKRDALIVNTEGDVTHQPGTCMGIVLDRTMEKIPELTTRQRVELYEKHRQIEALFPVLKVTHRYHLANRANAPTSYTENVVLGRNFILPPGAPKEAEVIVRKIVSGVTSWAKEFARGFGINL